jgi:hypothetical protein
MICFITPRPMMNFHSWQSLALRRPRRLELLTRVILIRMKMVHYTVEVPVVTAV